jgi:site-specific DNA-methyltransferase (adenine-specific)
MKDRNLNAGDNWKTPKDLYDRLNKEYQFDFDPCPYCESEITPDKDVLLIEWGNCNFVNPPYSRNLKEAFVKRGIEMMKKGKTSVFLLPVSTSTALFHDHILPNASKIEFLRGRVKFEGRNTFGELVTNKCGMHDSMIVVFNGQYNS